MKVYKYIYNYLYMFIYICMYTYVYTYIHTHKCICTYINSTECIYGLRGPWVSKMKLTFRYKLGHFLL